MVFYFIIFLSIIFLLCFPFRVKILFFYSFIGKKMLFTAKIGFIQFRPGKFEKKSKQKKNKTLPIHISIKKISIKKPIEFHLHFYSQKNTLLQKTENEILRLDLPKISGLLSQKSENIHIKLESSDYAVYTCSFSLSLKLNFFLIITSVLQTIKIGRKK